MKSKLDRNVALGLLGVLLLVFTACELDETSIYDEDDTGRPTPTIATIDPALDTWSGIGVVTISGTNFSTIPEENLVFFNAEQGDVLSASANELQVQVPNMAYDGMAFLDSIEIKVAVQGAHLFATYPHPYKLKNAAPFYGGFTDYDVISAVAANANDTIFVATGDGVFLIEPDSAKRDEAWGRVLTTGVTTMKIGPEGYLYYAQGYAMFRINPANPQVPDGWFAAWGSTETAVDMDFDMDGKIFVAQRSGLIIKVDASAPFTPGTPAPVEEWGVYTVGEVTAIRVFDGDLYVAGVDTSSGTCKVWKNEILADTLGATIPVADWSTLPEAGSSKITCITFSADDEMYVGANKNIALAKLEGGSFVGHYTEILTPPTKNMVWGGGEYLYMARLASSTAMQRVIQVNMMEAGAPYYGR